MNGLRSMDQTTFERDVRAAEFMKGVVNEWWNIVSDDEWPVVVIWIAAANRPSSPTGFFFRCNFLNYPQKAPTAQLWDNDKNAPLEHASYPKGQLVQEIFRSDWNDGQAIYAPFDRQATDTHPQWIQEHPRRAWTPDRTLGWYCQTIWTYLNNESYCGV